MNYSNKEYKKLGDRIRSNPKDISDEDYLMLQELRLTYKDPLAVIFTSIEKMAYKVDANCICTYRVKRIESIISKLIRFPEMQVNRAEDIAGCRCIMTSTDQVYQLYNKIQKNQDRLPYEVKGVIHDYIEQPKESGYKSVHLNVTLRDDNRRVEIQLRALEHHNWATLVEITDLLYASKLKEYGNKVSPDLFDFHFLMSKDLQELSKDDMYRIADIMISRSYIMKLGEVFARNYLDVREKWNKLKLQNNHFFLIATDSEGMPDFAGFLDFEEAEKAYFDRFTNNRDNENIVLTHLRKTDFTKISIAYSNYFLTFNNTIIKILKCLSEAVVGSYKQNKIKQFDRYYQCFLDILDFWADKQLMEMASFQNDKYAKNYLKVRTEWRNSIMDGMGALNIIYKDMNERLTFSLLHLVPYRHKVKKRRAFLEKMRIKNNANEATQ